MIMDNAGTPSALEISGVSIPVKYRYSIRYRRISLKVSGDGLTVTAPVYAAGFDINSFIQSNLQWIYRKYTARREMEEKLPIAEGVEIPYRGKSVKISASESDVSGFFEDKCLIPGRILDFEGDEKKAAFLVELYCIEAMKSTESLIAKWRGHLSGSIKVIRIKEMKSRWGSCSSKGGLSLNWRLIMTPDEVFEYVFVHELCHIKFPSHNASFWREVHSLFPESENCRGYLRKKQRKLMSCLPAVFQRRTLLSIPL